tara:strand:- start:1721 stop:2518 length:798 start_codon:yes stop_codon:yes gene_type:complete
MRALVAGVGIAIVAGPLGCFIVWRRLAFFGDTISHAALLGVALSLLINSSTTLVVFLVSAFVALSLLLIQKRTILPADSVLSLLSHSTLALGLVVLGFISWVRVDIMGVLFGDILATSVTDILIIYIGGLTALIALAIIWRPLFAATVDREIAKAEGMNPDRANIIFVFLIACVIAISIEIIGVLLITAMLIIPAAAARRFSSSPEQMVVISGLIGSASVIGGLFGSLTWDTPSGPTIVVAALACFLVSLSPLANILVLKKAPHS